MATVSRYRWMPVMVFCWCTAFSVLLAEPVQSLQDEHSPWELQITGPKCESSSPVCGEGGISFESSCHAISAGVRIIKEGACSEESTKPASCTITCFRADPVCGEDGSTYWCGSAEATCAGTKVAHTGFCDIQNAGPGERGRRAAESLFLVHLIWLVLAGLLVIAGLA